MAVHPAESTPVFFARVDELGLSDLKPEMTKRGWNCFSDFAMACSDFSGKDNAAFQKEIVEPLVGDKDDRLTRIRRLFVQSYAVHASYLEKSQDPAVERTVTMHPLDREEATKTVRARITGFVIEGDSEPSFKLINTMATVLTNGVVRYPAWETLTSRKQEINDIPEVPGLKLLETETGVTFVPVTPNDDSADLSGEMRWDLAFRREGVAMEISGLMVYDAHSLWHEVLRSAYLTEPPPGYRRVTWAQLRNADRELWRRVAGDCTSGCKAKPGQGKTAFETSWLARHLSPEVRHLLLPLPASSSSQSSASPPSESTSVAVQISRLENRLKIAQEQIAGQKRRLEAAGAGSQSRSGGGGGRSNRRQRRQDQPAAGAKGSGKSKFAEDWNEKNYAHTTKDNEPICYNFNLLKGCTSAALGQRCPRGWHVCAKPQCQDKKHPHSATSH